MREQPLCINDVALAPLLMRYSFEIRMYAMASLIGVVATVMILVRAHSSKRWTDWLIYGALVAFGMYAILLALLWLAHLAWLVAMDAGKL